MESTAPRDVGLNHHPVLKALGPSQHGVVREHLVPFVRPPPGRNSKDEPTANAANMLVCKRQVLNRYTLKPYINT